MYRVDELGRAGDALLQHVAHPHAPAGEELYCVSGLEMLGQHEDADVRVLALELDGRLEALGRVGRRHADVDDDDIGPFGLDGGEQPGCIRALGDDNDAFVGEQPGDPGAHEGRVVDEHDAHRRLHSLMMPRPSTLRLPAPVHVARSKIGGVSVVRASTDAQPWRRVNDGAMPLRALLVDDDARFRAMARRALVADGVDIVAEVGKGIEVQDEVEHWRPDVVLLDIGLPDIDGLEVARRLGAREGGPVVILTSSRDVAYGRRVAAGLAAGYLPKDELSLAAILDLARPAP
jgi:CheY-like chemotaxis protein